MAVAYNLNDAAKAAMEPNASWSCCTNPSCSGAYVSTKQQFDTADLITPLFFKDSSDTTPICYCSGLTRGEIKSAVSQGKRTAKEIKELTQKHAAGLCEERNPLGRCCANVLRKAISDASNSAPSFSVAKCSCCK